VSGAGAGAGRKGGLGAAPQGLRGQPPPGGGTGLGSGTSGRARGGCTRVGKGWAAWVSVEGEEGGPGGRLEGGGVAVFSLNTVKTLAWNLRLWSSQPAGISSAAGEPPGKGLRLGAAARAGGMGPSSAAFLSPVPPSPFFSLSYCSFGGLC